MIKKIYSILFISLFFTVACQEENEVDGSLRVAFKEFGSSLADATEKADVLVLSSRAAETSIDVKISVAAECGALLDQFSIVNANGELLSLEENSFSINIAQGTNSSYFSVVPNEASFPVGAVEFDFFIEEVSNANINDSHLNYNLRVGTGAGFFAENVNWDFEDEEGTTPDGFFTYNEPGTITDKPIRLSKERVSHEGNQYLSANAFQGNGSVVDTWLITNRRFDFRTAEFADFIIDVKYKFEGEGQIEFLWSDNYCGTGNPNEASWTNLTVLENQIPENVSNTYETITEESNEVLGKVVHFAIKFSEATADGSGEYAIDNLMINTVAGDDGGDDGGGSESGENSFSTDFEGCSDDFAIPQGFEQVHISDKTDRGWGCRGFGLEGSRAVQATAFGGSAGEVDAWLITFNSFDFSDISSVNLQMQLFSNFDGPGQIELKYSEDYSGSGSPDEATWTSINAVNDLMPDAGSQEWVPVDVDVTELGGKEVYFAFHFYGANDEGSSSWAIDNLAINDPDVFDGSEGGGDDDGGGDDGGGDSGTTVSIADAKGQMGENVTITGIVTTPDYGANNGQYYVQDETAGINIIHFSNNGLVELGDEVEIVGTIGEFSNQTQIEVSSVNVISSGNAIPEPTSITVSDLSLDSELLGSRVVIENVSLIDASQWPTEAISSSSGVNVEAVVDGTEFIIRIDRGESFYDGSSAPSGTFTLSGILGNFNDDVQILPFVEGDVE